MTLFRSQVDWSGWAATADPRVCEGCGTTFAPNHPRRRFCGGDGCPGRRQPPPPRKRKGLTGRQQAAARTAGIQGFVADVMLEINLSDPAGSIDELLAAAKILLAAERAGNTVARQQAVVRLCAVGAVRSVSLVPPPVVDASDDAT